MKIPLYFFIQDFQRYSPVSGEISPHRQLRFNISVWKFNLDNCQRISCSRGNSLDRISLPTFESSSFLHNPVHHKEGIRIITNVCLTRVEVVQTKINLGNIKVMKSYNILFPFSLRHIAYETLVLFTLRPSHMLSCALTL